MASTRRITALTSWIVLLGWGWLGHRYRDGRRIRRYYFVCSQIQLFRDFNQNSCHVWEVCDINGDTHDLYFVSNFRLNFLDFDKRQQTFRGSPIALGKLNWAFKLQCRVIGEENTCFDFHEIINVSVLTYMHVLVTVTQVAGAVRFQ